VLSVFVSSGAAFRPLVLAAAIFGARWVFAVLVAVFEAVTRAFLGSAVAFARTRAGSSLIFVSLL
jgi:hypothetical protein